MTPGRPSGSPTTTSPGCRRRSSRPSRTPCSALGTGWSVAGAGVGAADHLLHRGGEAALDLADQAAALHLRGDGEQQRADGEQQADVLDGALPEAAVAR